MKINHFFRVVHESIYGLPHFAQLVILKGIALSNIEDYEDIISNVTAEEIAVSLSINRAPGRKHENITKSKVLNAIKTIKRNCADVFKFETINQRIIIRLPALNKLNFNSEVATVKKSEGTPAKSLVNNEESRSFCKVKYTEDTTEVATGVITEQSSNININYKHNTNKQTVSHKKSPISENFYPSEETVHIAQSRGLLKVTDSNEIAAFIAYNQEQGSRWEDYNPIFLLWLERCFSHKPKQKKQITRTTKDANNECNLSKTSTAKSTVAQALRELEDELCESQINEQQGLPHFNIQAHHHVMDDITQPLQTSLS